jgi:hypothetical protein
LSLPQVCREGGAQHPNCPGWLRLLTWPELGSSSLMEEAYGVVAMGWEAGPVVYPTLSFLSIIWVIANLQCSEIAVDWKIFWAPPHSFVWD